MGFFGNTEALQAHVILDGVIKERNVHAIVWYSHD